MTRPINLEAADFLYMAWGYIPAETREKCKQLEEALRDAPSPQPEAVASIAQVLPLPPQPETVTTSTDSGEWATKAETDLLHLWCEYTGGHLGGSEFADMVCDIVTDQILEKRHRLPEPQKDEQ